MRIYIVLGICGLMFLGCTTEPPKTVVVRYPTYDSENQREIDATREEIDQRTKMGRGEQKSWNQRYEGQNSEVPYQGPAGGEK